MMNIEIMIKSVYGSVYGEDKVYPVCDKAKTFASIAGTTTLTHNTLCLVERLGYEIVRVEEPKDWRKV